MTSNQVREHARKKYIEPAIAKHQQTVKVRAGDVHKELALKNRVPTVCQALESKTFLQDNNLVLESKEGPPSGLSTSVVFTYRLAAKNTSQSALQQQAGAAPPRTRNLLNLLKLKGIGKEMFAALGGGENFIRAERRAFAEGVEKQDRERGIL